MLLQRRLWEVWECLLTCSMYLVPPNMGSVGTWQTWSFPEPLVLPTHSAVPGKNCGKKQAQGQMNAHGRLSLVSEPWVELHHVLHPLLMLSCPPHCLLYPELPVSPTVYFHWQCVPLFLPPAFTGPLFHHELHSSPFFSTFPSQLLFLSLSTTPNLLRQHFQIPCWSSVCPFIMSCSLFPASWLTAPVAGN